MRNTDQRSSTGPVDAGPRSCGVCVGEQTVDLAQRHASSPIAHLEKSIWSEQLPHLVTAVAKMQRLSFTFTVRSSVPRATCAWMAGYSMASPYNSMVARMAFCIFPNVKQKRKEMYANVKLRPVNKLSNCEFKKVKILP